MALLDIQQLQTTFDTRSGPVRAVDGVSLRVERGETVALVGESGSGKSVTAYSVLRLLPRGQGRISGGRILFDGQDLATLPEAAMRALRGNRISMIFQEPLSALNPVRSIGWQIVEAIRLHRPVREREAWARAVALLAQVGIPSPERRVHDFAHQLSGGMRQRVVIAIALACEPDLLIADEPTTALDVTTQAQILALLRTLQAEHGMGLLLITHDLGVVAEVADRAAVMYAGRVVEQAPVDVLFEAPAHPYTAGLLASLAIEHLPPGSRLPEIGGTVPSPANMPPGCAFAPRCSRAVARCHAQAPVLQDAGHGVHVACHLPLPAGQAASWEQAA
ncbi:MAG: ABC transporter ATP-binding protein [Pseudacidovorax sp.]|uniref:ABC transporter ATP-binding protein n=1 Tax=Pseudacidovorax sp. TaxID=1934311 RepID=UPI001B59066F|nr:ABC transporter ATP-binding protein [Pseudacidovorax sp.]MBP6895498.1 ABC transporter ATP-binding protein [Pseudacidovorax sp.]